MNAGKHHDAAERYGRHSEANADGLPAAELLRRAIANGEAICLAWRADDTARGQADAQEEFPTAVLPIIRPDEGDANPGTASNQTPLRLTG